MASNNGLVKMLFWWLVQTTDSINATHYGEYNRWLHENTIGTIALFVRIRIVNNQLFIQYAVCVVHNDDYCKSINWTTIDPILLL